MKDSITYNLAAVGLRFRDDLEKAMVEIGLHSGQVFLLSELWQEDSLSQSELARRLRISAPTVNSTIARLVEGGFVQTSKDPVDTRIVRVSLTERGAGFRQVAETRWAEFEELTFSGLTEAERLIFQIILRKLISRS